MDKYLIDCNSFGRVPFREKQSVFGSRDPTRSVFRRNPMSTRRVNSSEWWLCYLSAIALGVPREQFAAIVKAEVLMLR